MLQERVQAERSHTKSEGGFSTALSSYASNSCGFMLQITFAAAAAAGGGGGGGGS
jgi:hypothetical protein